MLLFIYFYWNVKAPPLYELILTLLSHVSNKYVHMCKILKLLMCLVTGIGISCLNGLV